MHLLNPLRETRRRLPGQEPNRFHGNIKALLETVDNARQSLEKLSENPSEGVDKPNGKLSDVKSYASQAR